MIPMAGTGNRECDGYSAQNAVKSIDEFAITGRFKHYVNSITVRCTLEHTDGAILARENLTTFLFVITD